MFREVYKKVMSEVEPSEGLLLKILSLTDANRKFKRTASWIATVAAVFVVALAVAAAYPYLADLSKQRREQDYHYSIQMDEQNNKNTVKPEDVADNAERTENGVASASSENEITVDVKEREENSASEKLVDSDENFLADHVTDNNIAVEDSSVSDSDDSEMVIEEKTHEKTNPEVIGEEAESESSSSLTSGGGGGGGSSGASSGGAGAAIPKFDYNSVNHENVQTVGFSNAGGTAVTDRRNALALAKNEIDVHGAVSVRRDEINGVWSVCFFAESEKIYVYISDDGFTLMIAREKN